MKKNAPKHQPLKPAVIDTEVATFIAAAVEQRHPVHTNWVVHSLVLQHQEIRGADAAWYLTCAYGHIRARVRDALRKQGLITEAQHADSQMVLSGWQHLQQSYLVEREEVSQIIPIDLLTEEELLAKAYEYRVMGQGCFAHADELDRYREEKQTTAA